MEKQPSDHGILAMKLQPEETLELSFNLFSMGRKVLKS